MAFVDWNGNGKKDGFDNAMEFGVLSSMMDDNNEKKNDFDKVQYQSRRMEKCPEQKGKNNISFFEMIFIILGGLILLVSVCDYIYVEVDKVPVVLFFIFWGICSWLIYSVVDYIKKNRH